MIPPAILALLIYSHSNQSQWILWVYACSLPITNHFENRVEQVKQSEERWTDYCPHNNMNQVSLAHPHFLHFIAIHAPAFHGAQIPREGAPLCSDIAGEVNYLLSPCAEQPAASMTLRHT